ncbi:MAG: hypothetical protein AAFQ98_12240 [Bacteroidota bacterium]
MPKTCFYLCLGMILGLPFLASAQVDSADYPSIRTFPALEAYIEAAKVGERPTYPQPFPTDTTTLMEWHATLWVQLLRDTAGLLAYPVYDLMHRLAQSTTYRQLRRAVAGTMAYALLMGHSLSANLGEWLMEYTPEDFHPSERTFIEITLPGYRGAHIREVAWLAGWLRVAGQTDHLRAWLPYASPVDRWYLYAALARLGDEGAIRQMVYILDRTGVSQDALAELYPAALYTRRPELITPLVDIVMTDDYRCASPNYAADKEISCAYLAMHYLPEVIEDFPYQVDFTGEIDAPDLSAALVEIRAWIASHPNYQLKE